MAAGLFPSAGEPHAASGVSHALPVSGLGGQHHMYLLSDLDHTGGCSTYMHIMVSWPHAHTCYIACTQFNVWNGGYSTWLHV